VGPYYVVRTKGGGALAARAVIVGTGARQKRLEVPGEKDYIMRGLCYSALSYAPLFIDRETVVIGDDELALRSAAELATVARRVTLVRPLGTAMDSPLYGKLQNAQHVAILNEHQVVAVIGDEYARLVVVKDPAGQEIEIPADGTFIEMGLVPNSQMVAGLVDQDENGRIKIDCRNSTSAPGVYAAGDVTTSYAEQVLVAIGEGAKAALTAYEYLLPML
jgi:alkyl hydroperoxide reductase subunit AhpF